MPLNFNNSKKLTITAYKDAKRSRAAGEIGVFEACFNPDTVTQHSQNHYRLQQGLNSGGGGVSFAFTQNEQITLTIVIDGSSLGAGMNLKSAAITPEVPEIDVQEKVRYFRSLAFTINGDIHQPNYLKLSLGTTLEEVSCRLLSFTVEYSNIDDNGNPDRAEIKATFIKDSSAFKQKAITAKKSADLTHARTVVSGDTLPLLSKAIYGTALAYIELARFNKLDHFRRLRPGTKLTFPPRQNIRKV